MEFGTDNAIFEEESNFIDIKTEIEDFIKTINEPYLEDFKTQLNIIFQNYQSSFNNVSITRRQLIEVQEKLKRNIRNKNEVIKNIEDDTERYNTLKNEFENYYYRIDEKKFEETEKEKIIKMLNEEIISLEQKKDQENFSSFKPQELDLKSKLIAQKEEIESDLAILEEKKRQGTLLENKLIDDKITAEKLGEECEKEWKIFDEKIKALESMAIEERTKKKNFEDKFTSMKEDNNRLKNELLRFENETKMSLSDQSKLQNYCDSLMSEKHNKLTMINQTNKKIDELRKKYEENRSKKLKAIEDTISALKMERVKKDKDRSDFNKEIKKFLSMRSENLNKFSEINKEVEVLSESKREKVEEIEQIENEIRKRRSEFMQLKTEMTKMIKNNDDKKRELEKLSSEIAELDNQNIALENANHRAVNETYGIKRETLNLELQRDNIEKEKNFYAKQASDANMEHTQSLEKLKNLNEAITELKEKNIQAETKLKQQKKIYEALKADSNRFEKKHQEAQREIKDILEEKLKKEGKYNSLKIELDYKQRVIKDTEEKLEGFQETVEKNVREVDDLKGSCKNYKQSIEKYIENNTNLKKLTTAAEADYQNQKKEFSIVVREKDFLEGQLIQRNKEITSLYEKIKVLQQELFKMHQQYESKLLETEKLKSTREFLLEEYSKTENIIKNIFELKVIKIKLEKEVLTAKNKVRSLEDETKKPLNIHRWTKLEYSDPEKYELISQINSLQRRLIAKTEEVSQKEELIQEKEKLYIKLKGIIARQSGVEMEEPLAKYKQKIREETDRLKKLKEEIKNYRLDIKNYEYEIRRVDEEIEKMKNKWYSIMKQSNREAQNMFNNVNVIDENNNEEYDDQVEIPEDGYNNEDNQELNQEEIQYYKAKVNSA